MKGGVARITALCLSPSGCPIVPYGAAKNKKERKKTNVKIRFKNL